MTYNLTFLKTKLNKTFQKDDNGFFLTDLLDFTLIYSEFQETDDLNDLFALIYKEYSNPYIWLYNPQNNHLIITRPWGEIKTFIYNPNWKRNDYILGKKQILDELNESNFDDLFSSKAVFDHFYKRLWDIRLELAKKIKKHNQIVNKDAILCAQRIIDRIIFIYFICKIDLIKESRDNLEINIDGSDFFDTFIHNSKTFEHLKALFFDYFSFPHDFHNDLFQCSHYYFKIPFLNGGLFRIQNYENKDNEKINELDINIPDYQWIELFTLLNEYIWIIRSEKVDERALNNKNHSGILTPEILGHIYEKFVITISLLAEINLENFDLKIQQDSLLVGNHKIGAYYTPSKITNYICSFSIRSFIEKKLSQKYGKIYNLEQFLNNSKKNKIEPEILEYIYHQLEIITICDNACGSGAFLIAAEKVLFDYRWNIFKTLKEKDKKRYDNLIKKIDSNNLKYALRKEIVLNNIYGVDIMDGAVEITKLRLWLSLISELKHKKNQEIKPLPNIDFNIIAGNTLIGFTELEEAQEGLHSFANVSSLDQLLSDRSNLINIYRTTSDKNKNEELLNKIEKIDKKIKPLLDKKYFKRIGKDIDREEFVSQIGLFHWGLEFPNIISKGGFDLILGNPPYLRSEHIDRNVGDMKYKNILNKLYKNHVKFGKTRMRLSKTIDLSLYFILRSYELLNDFGIHSYIITNKWLRSKYGKAIRHFLINKTKIIKIVDFEGKKVFRGATVDTLIYFLEKTKPNKNILKYCQPKKISFSNLDYREYKQDDFDQNAWIFIDPKFLSIKGWLKRNNKNFNTISEKEIHRGLVSGFEPAFVINADKRQEIINKDPKASKFIHPLIRGENIGPFELDWNNEYIIVIPKYYTNQKFGELKSKEKPDSNMEAEVFIQNHLPSIYEHLASYKDYEPDRGKGLIERYDQGEYWWELRGCSYYDGFEKPKIMWSELSQKNSFAWDIHNLYATATGYFANKLPKRYIILLNSTVIEFYMQVSAQTLGSSGIRYQAQFVKKIPLALVPKIDVYENLIDYLHVCKISKCNQDLINYFQNICNFLAFEIFFMDILLDKQLYLNKIFELANNLEDILQPIDFEDFENLRWISLQKSGNNIKHDYIKKKQQKLLEIIQNVYREVKNNSKIKNQLEVINKLDYVQLIQKFLKAE